ncbi:MULTISPECIES: phosphate starvation-inducible protein PhoH [Brevibacillus]|jgi:hypothetical protein|uniref:phosphate starvation-inducible protein PhoH n=1 Tax=Brevibacillus TaxID=55080 RepID=UPI000EE51954|nr:MULTISPECIES: phosphate starvation-inducible protein PhoH [Brevibacillus]MDH6351677.1 hypothetical protein [Brevibacillus sp. 1238]MDR4997546.1 phosphate starvation-inducible protein PhoH [Brevibacillus parabrevis]MED2255847.1 phosphate starvation-inducible protein PhoH [Brevibacillus parabrevis]NRQ55219.1 phosphate starvation-inducible protein PhoH [Brevibacillus sp. HD1.4A]UED68988.1 phosphate starvation-inducible protein PhoH [Brevibacillus sp. HD3.3A]
MDQRTDFLMLDSGCCFGEPRLKDPNYQDFFSFIDVYDLPGHDLSPYKCLVITGLIDQELLYKQKEQIRDFLDGGKVLVFSGNLFLPWLPGASAFVPKEIRNHSDYDVTIAKEHPIFAGVQTYDMTYNKGVAGFFARGHHPLPDGAEVLLTLPGGEPITYIDRNSTKGTILVHSGNDLFGYNHPGKSTGRIALQLTEWARNEYRQLQEPQERGAYA